MGDFTVQTGISERHSMATFLRLFALKKIENDYDRILYLDADVSIRHGDVGVFWDVDMGGRPAAAVRDWTNWGNIKRHSQRYFDQLGVSMQDGGYFNSGFLLVNGPVWTEMDITQRVYNFLEEHPDKCRYHDQSALNGVLAGQWAEVSPLWNWQTKVLHHILMIETCDPHLVHFNARRKPWRDRDRLLGNEFRGPMIELADKVGWEVFDRPYSRGPMRPRNARIRSKHLAELYASMPNYLEHTRKYINRSDFLDSPKD